MSLSSSTAFAATSTSYNNSHVYNYTTDGTMWADYTLSGNMYATTSPGAYITGNVSSTDAYLHDYISYTGLDGMTVSSYSISCNEGSGYDCVQTIYGGEGNSYVGFAGLNPSTSFRVIFDSDYTTQRRVQVSQQLLGDMATCQSYNCDPDDTDVIVVSSY
ncbi:hypothetical protein [Desulfosporosinus sp. OT]|uniref:hypothetical protein n=1 Tax=Desulfosporosinus sp. OT TaxID=913865 RepID=UPI001300C289|nr:hypothetical protein [Desulfosporosinus sp. OT]